MATVTEALIATTILGSIAAVPAYFVYGNMEPRRDVAAAPETYSNAAQMMRLRPVRAHQSATVATPVAPGVSFQPTWATVPSQQHFTCGGVAAANNPVPWKKAREVITLSTGERGFRQNNADMVFFDIIGGREGRSFGNAGFCDFTTGHIADKEFADPLRQGERDVPLAVTVFRGDISSRHNTTLFDGALKAWTTSFSQDAGYCDIRVRFNRQAERVTPDFVHDSNRASRVFYLVANDRELYKFDLRKSTGQSRFGACPVEITQIRLPRVPDAPARIYGAGRPTAGAQHAVGSSYQMPSNIKITFNDQTRMVTTERDVPLTISPNTRYYITRSYTASEEISFGETRTRGADIGSPLLSTLLTGGLIDLEYKNYWEGRFSQGMAQASSGGAQVELDGNHCTQWLYSVHKTIREGTVVAREFGVKEPVGFSITERIHIEATPQCGRKPMVPVALTK